MKVRALTILLATCAALAFSDPSPNALNAALDPSRGMKELSDAISQKDGGASLPRDRFFLLTGRIGTIIDRSEEGGPFLGESELVSGEWIGFESVRAFRVYLKFNGMRFKNVVDAESAEYVKPGTLVVIIGSLVGTTKEYGSDKNAGIIKVERLIKIE
jgi:hypothetical protein